MACMAGAWGVAAPLTRPLLQLIGLALTIHPTSRLQVG